MKGCEARALAIIEDRWQIEPSIDMLIGSYVDAHFENMLPKFKSEHPEIFTQKGELKSQFKHAEKIIDVAETDDFFMKFMNGEKQVVLTGEIFGLPFKGKLDVRHDECIVDLKVLRDMKKIWIPDQREFVNFVDAWGYADQLAIYQELEFQKTGIKKPCYLAVLTKEKYPNKEIIEIPQHLIDSSMAKLEFHLPKIDLVKNREIDAIKCCVCDYCIATKKLNTVKTYESLTYDIYN